MQRQNILDLPPRGAGSWPGSEELYRPLPGRVVLESLKVPVTGSGLIMTDRQKHFCDVARVTASGVPELSKGQLVLLIAGTGLYTDSDLSGRVVGTGRYADLPRGDDAEPDHPDHWYDCIPARLEGYHWVLSPGWAWAKKLPQGQVLTLDRLDKYRVFAEDVLGFEGASIDLTPSQITERGWELFCMKRPGGFERHLVQVQ